MKILGSDFDGTLNHGGLTDEKIDAIKNWQTKGNKFGIVSGRSDAFRTELTKNYPDLKIDFLAAFNGGFILDSDGKVIFEAVCTDPSAKDLVADLFSFGCKFAHVNGNGYVCIANSKEDCPPFVAERFICHPDDFSGFDMFRQISIQMPTTAEAEEIARLVGGKYSDRLNPLQNGRSVDIVPVGINKAEGMYRVMEHFGGKFEDVIVVGDNVNDLDMIREFRSYAMQNGVDEVKSAACGIVEDVTDIFKLMA